MSSQLEQVRDDLMPTEGCDPQFFPSCSNLFGSDMKLWNYMTKARVIMILEECALDLGTRDKEALAETICGMPKPKKEEDFISYRKVFTILIYLRLPEKILRFVGEQLHDNLLPLCHRGDQRNPRAICISEKDDCHPCFNDWSKYDMAQFLQLQQQLCPPFFEQQEVNARRRHYKFAAGIALPLLTYRPDCDDDASRGFEEVMKVELPEEHGNLKTYDAGKKRIFAVKRLLHSDRKRFEQECILLDAFNKSVVGNNSDISTVLSATFEVGSNRGPNFYLLFPCTDCNLRHFWDFHSGDDQKIPKFSEWMVNQLCGLAQALETLHNFNTRTDSALYPLMHGMHGTIKPENILVFGHQDGSQLGYGILQLADFGLAKPGTRPADQLVVPSKLHCYCPPEGDLICRSQQSVDVWELGCLFLEFIVWLVAGNTGLGQFLNARSSPGLFHPYIIGTNFYQMTATSVEGVETGIKIEINRGVNTWVDQVHNSQDSTAFLHDFTDFILREMLTLGSIDPDAGSSEALEPVGDNPPAKVSEFNRQHGQRIEEDELVKALAAFAKKDDKYFQTPASYVGKDSFMPAPVHLSMTIGQIKKRVALRGRAEWLVKTNRYIPAKPDA